MQKREYVFSRVPPISSVMTIVLVVAKHARRRFGIVHYVMPARTTKGVPTTGWAKVTDAVEDCMFVCDTGTFLLGTCVHGSKKTQVTLFYHTLVRNLSEYIYPRRHYQGKGCFSICVSPVQASVSNDTVEGT